MPRLDRLAVDDLVDFSHAFRTIAEEVATMEGAAQRIVDHLRSELSGPDDRPAVALARLYKTHRFGDLEPPLQDFARAAHGGPVDQATRCLTLLGTAGDEPEWNDRHRSAGHQAIPLVSEEAVAQSPMVAGLIAQLGLEVGEVLEPDAVTARPIALHHRDYDVFFVPDAHGSPQVPAQEGFVEPYDIRSVVGCGGVLPSGDLFALILFSRVTLDERTADLFRTLALSVKATLVRYTFAVFSA